MISNLRPCCRQYVTSNENFYVEVKNECTNFISFFLYYNIGDKRVAKPSPVFGPGKIQRVAFPGDALYIRMKVVNCFFNPPTVICSRSILYFMINRFKVIISPQGNIECVNIQK